MITLTTNFGQIKLELDFDKTPITAKNFLRYVEEGFYDNTIFHRVIDGFMIQGGGFEEDMTQKSSHKPILNEAKLGEKNKRGTIAMARTADPHSASAQFFINLEDNHFLNFTSESPEGWGYCVFGKVVEGMDVVEKIATVTTDSAGMHENVPVDPVVIEKASSENQQETAAG